MATKVFISWSGDRSRALGQALHNWLPLVLHFVEPWISQSDIEAGERWANEVGKELEVSNYGIICITRENIASPWILFEAGALAKSMEQGRVIPLLLDIDFRDISGPLAQFQAKKVDKDGLAEIVTSINKLDSAPVLDARREQLFELSWPKFEEDVLKIPGPSDQTKKNRPQSEILEELVTGVRGLDLRFRESIEDGPPRWRRKGRFHPMMIHEIMHSMELPRGDPFRVVVFASMFREEIPWLYELAVDVYRSGGPRTTKGRKARHRLAAAYEALRRGPVAEMLLRDRDSYRMLREFDHFLIEGLQSDESQTGLSDEPDTESDDEETADN